MQQQFSRPHKVEGEGLGNLLSIAGGAALGVRPFYPFAFFGWPSTWFPLDERFSEYRIINPWRLRRTLKFLWNITVPSIPRNPPVFGPPLVNGLFWQPSVILQRPDHNGSYTSFPDEAWFYINGVMTNDSVAQLNSAQLAQLFHRPITMIWNATDSVPIDLVECALGKQWYWNVEPAVVGFPPLYDALRDDNKKRVVVIAHSQGTIILANILQLLQEVGPARAEAAVEAYAPPEIVFPDETDIKPGDFDPLSDDHLKKLEIYLFANCANKMAYLKEPPVGERPVPWIESYGNEFDIVARLGMFAPHAAEHGIQLAGPMYQHNGKWGHLFGAHYLHPIEDYQRSGRKQGGSGTSDPFVLLNPDAPHCSSPRLFDYINGGSPSNKIHLSADSEMAATGAKSLVNGRKTSRHETVGA